jgi:hypothetical protein
VHEIKVWNQGLKFNLEGLNGLTVVEPLNIEAKYFFSMIEDCTDLTEYFKNTIIHRQSSIPTGGLVGEDDSPRSSGSNPQSFL